MRKYWAYLIGTVSVVVIALVATLVVGNKPVLGLDLYLVALVTFGPRIFQNLALIRRHFL